MGVIRRRDDFQILAAVEDGETSTVDGEERLEVEEKEAVEKRDWFAS